MPTQGQANAEIIARMIEDAGKSVGEGMTRGRENRIQLEALRLKEMRESFTELRQMPPEQRKKMLSDPSYVVHMAYGLGPLLGKPEEQKAELSRRVDLLKSLGEPTEEEAAKLKKAKTEAEGAEADTGMKKLKLSLAKGETQPTPLNLLMSGEGPKDPLAAALFTAQATDPEAAKTITNLALAEKNGGPIAEASRTRDWYEKMLNQGLPPGVAMQSAIAIAKGQWDKVPTEYVDASGKKVPIKAKAEQELAINMMNAVSRAKEVKGNIENSIATSAAALAEKAGIGLDQARADVVALRNGQPVPFSTAALREHVALDTMLKQQEVAKNTTVLLRDRSGIEDIKGALGTLISQYKEAGLMPGSLDTGKLKTQIQGLQKDYVDRLSQLYGIQLPPDQGWESTTLGAAGANAFWATWDGMKASGAYGLDLGSDFVKSMDGLRSTGSPGTGAPVIPGRNTPKPPTFSADQQKLLDGFASTMTNGISDPNVPVGQKKAMLDWVNNVLMPVKNGTADFNTLFANTPSPGPQD